MPYYNITRAELAEEAIGDIATMQEHVTAGIGFLAAAQSRMEYALGHAYSLRDNYSAGASKLMDADVAMEMARFVKEQVLQQSTTALLAQANQNQKTVISLLDESAP